MNQLPEVQYVTVMREALAAPNTAAVIAHVVGQLRPPLRTILVGGFLRDAVLRACFGIDKPARDLDFIIFGLADDEEVHDHFKTSDAASRTTFGGLKLQLAGMSVDIWRAEQQMQVGGHTPRACPPQELLKYVTLTTDAGGYDPVTGEFYESGFYRALTRREIDLGERSLWLPRWQPYHLAHLAAVWHTTRFSLSARAVSRVRETATPTVQAQARAYLVEHKHLPDGARLIQALVHSAQQAPLHHEAPR